ncbi:MAG: hypothetical protein MK101_01670 [Phycisphaerales bacterium]|nr:hypothetical protein [Phycisphaerales bacterium]
MLGPTIRTLIGLILATAAGCATRSGPDRLTVEPAKYSAAFDAAVAAVRAHGLEPRVMDRRGGVIETDAIQTPSLLEPWAWQGTDRDLALLNTLGNTRRRIRVEFTPSSGPPLARTPAQTLAEPDWLGMEVGEDLTRSDKPIDARVWVWVERTYRPGRNLGSWTLTASSYETPLVNDETWEQVPGRIVVPEARDRGAEQLLLSEVAKAIHH